MAQDSSDSLSETLESSIFLNDDRQPQEVPSTSSSLSRNLSSSRLNAKAPAFVPRTTTSSPSSSTTTTITRTDLSQPRLVIPPPSPPGVIHVYPAPNSPFRVPIPSHVPVQNHHHSYPPLPTPPPPPHHHHHVPVQYQHHHHNHQRQFYGGSGFVDQQEVASQAQRPAPVDLDPAMSSNKNGLTDEATQKILNQVEYYFSDLNLATTDHLMRFINKDPEGYVPISVVASFKKIKALISSNSQLASILQNTEKLMVSEDGKKVRRQHPLTESDMEELQSRIVVAENLPEDHCHQNLMKVFSAVGSVKTIRTCQPQASNGGASSASRTGKTDGMLFSNKLHAFVEFESVELAEQAVVELNDEGNWRNGLRVRILLKRTAKPAQARLKKAGHEGEAHHKEDDAFTSEQHEPNERHLEDPSLQSDSQSHEHTGEEHANDKEGVHKKGRSRGRGKGRGRPQYHHHNNRGNHGVGTPPSTNCVNNEHLPAVAKQQPPGPRMPDGTRGFSMGRGKPVSVKIA